MEKTKEKIQGCRKVDELGRIVIPIITREELGIEAKDYLEVFELKNKILLKKTQEVRTNENANRIRAVDEVGRFALPIELRKKIGINEKDEFNISIDGSTIVL